MIVTLRETTSTNDYAKKLAGCDVESFTTVVAHKQTAGKGRLGRSFDSPEDDGIYMSIIIYPDMKPEAVSAITIVAAMSVKNALVKVLEEVVSEESGQGGDKASDALRIKWPNDIVTCGKKICGILTEASMSGGTVKYMVVGIGVNVNNDSFADGLDDKAISLKQLSGQTFDKKGIIDEIISSFKKYYAIYEQKQNLQFMIDEYNASLVHTGMQVNILNGADSFQGICEGVDETGALVVRQQEHAEVTRVISGEVSVRGVYGYV